MANKYFQHATLNLYFHVGFDENSQPIVKRQSLQNVSQSVTPTALQTVAQAIGSLYNGDLVEIEQVSNEVIA